MEFWCGVGKEVLPLWAHSEASLPRGTSLRQYRIEFTQGMGTGVEGVVETERQRERREQRRRGQPRACGKRREVREQERGEGESERGLGDGGCGSSSPFYVESGIPDYCQVPVGRSLDEMSTVCMFVFVCQRLCSVRTAFGHWFHSQHVESNLAYQASFFLLSQPSYH